MTELEIKALQIANKYVGHYSKEEKIKKLGEEIIELAYALAKNDEENIEEEIGDCIFLLLDIATTNTMQMGLDYYVNLAAEKMEKRQGTKISKQVGKL